MLRTSSRHPTAQTSAFIEQGAAVTLQFQGSSGYQTGNSSLHNDDLAWIHLCVIDPGVTLNYHLESLSLTNRQRKAGQQFWDVF